MKTCARTELQLTEKAVELTGAVTALKLLKCRFHQYLDFSVAMLLKRVIHRAVGPMPTSVQGCSFAFYWFLQVFRIVIVSDIILRVGGCKDESS